MDYYDWIHYLVDLMIVELEEELGKNFARDGEMAWEAAKHCEAMMQRGGCYHAPRFFWGSAVNEAVGEITVPYNQWTIEQAVTKMGHEFLMSHDHHGALRYFPVIGAGLAVKEIGSGQVILFVTIRLK